MPSSVHNMFSTTTTKTTPKVPFYRLIPLGHWGTRWLSYACLSQTEPEVGDHSQSSRAKRMNAMRWCAISPDMNPTDHTRMGLAS